MKSPNRARAALSGITSVLLLAGCAVGPTHIAPSEALLAATAPTWQAGKELAKTNTASVRPTEFWSRWNDAALQSLVNAAMKNATSVEAAQARIAQARAGVGIARSGLMPSANAQGSATRSDQGQGPASVFAGAAQAAWELDLFGANRRGRDAALARLEARERDLDDVRVSLAADIATVYVNLRVNEALLAGFERDAASRLETERLTQLKAKTGFEAPANAALAAAAAAEARTRAVTQRAENDLSVKALVALTALSETEVRAAIANGVGQLTAAPSLAAPNVPASLLNDRADLRSIERELAAAIADIGAAEADRYPKISLTGSIGYSVSRAFGATSDGATWGFGPSVSIPLFDAGRRSANVELAKARHAELTANYRATALRAVREVEEALTRIESVKLRESDQRSSLADYEAFEKAAQARLRAGVGSVLELEDARRAVLAAQINVLALERERATAWIALFRAVGGDWQRSDLATPRVAAANSAQAIR